MCTFSGEERDSRPDYMLCLGTLLTATRAGERGQRLHESPRKRRQLLTWLLFCFWHFVVVDILLKACILNKDVAGRWIKKLFSFSFFFHCLRFWFHVFFFFFSSFFFTMATKRSLVVWCYSKKRSNPECIDSY